MTLEELTLHSSYSPRHSVPDWMIGCFRRHCISFANGESDNQTIVYWIQSRNFTIDLRLPCKRHQVPTKSLAEYTTEELEVLSSYEGWAAPSHWDGARLRWSNGAALQVTERWPEEAELKRIGNCMIEFAPSGAYVEDWRLQPTAPGPLIGLKLVEEHHTKSGTQISRSGGLIICGDYAALVVGRPSVLDAGCNTLPQMVAMASGNHTRLETLFDFETSVALHTPALGYRVHHSTQPARIGQSLLPEGDFEYGAERSQLHFRFNKNGQTIVWVFEIDVLETRHEFPLSTRSSTEARHWFQRETATLTRYTGVLK